MNAHASDVRALLKDELRERGLRATASRLAVLHALREAARPMSHADVVEALAGEPWDRATLYRNLVDLVGAGLLRRAELGDRVWRFEDAAPEGHDRASHAHFVCVECGTVECLPEATVAIDRQKQSPHAVRDGRVEVQVRGVCDACE